MSKKEQLTLAFPPEDCVAATQSDGGNCGSERCGQQLGAIRKEGSEAPLTSAKPRSIPLSHRELALAIFAQCDPVALGVEVIENNDDRNPATMLRALETFADWAYGKLGSAAPGPVASPGPVRVIWDLPLRGDGGNNPAPEKLEGGEK